LDFDTVEVITRDNQNQGVNLKEECLDFIKQEGWVKTKDFVFRVNAAEEYEALNLKGNGKNKHNIILSIGEDKVTRDAAKALFDKHHNTSVLVTLDEQGKDFQSSLSI
jgi:23S rRNA pseudoU1915 N3-methylase RlmH